ncbi:hypothetical protein L1887_30167 [Cichorium endivia]|nr:hypothetical protein L1887_30167 [Cichorium endivia]
MIVKVSLYLDLLSCSLCIKKLAGRIANKKQRFSEHKQSNESFKVWEDMEDQPVPMSLETTEPQKDLMAEMKNGRTISVKEKHIRSKKKKTTDAIY